MREELRHASSVLIGTHLNPDGDALGSSLALAAYLDRLGLDVEVLCHHPAPRNLRWLPGVGRLRQWPKTEKADLAIMVDLEAKDRLGDVRDPILQTPRLVVIDHHVPHEAPGDLRIVDVEASATALIIARLLLELGAEITPDMATNLLTGIITDTGSFRFRNTTPESFSVSAILLEKGADLARVNEEVFGRRPLASTMLLGHMLDTMRLECGNRIAVGVLTRADFERTMATDEETEGFVNEMLSIDSVAIAGHPARAQAGAHPVLAPLARRLRRGDRRPGVRRRRPPERGGLHPRHGRAGGRGDDRAEAARVLGVLLIDKPLGLTSHDVVNRVRRALGTRRVGHAGTLDPLATGVLVVAVGPATRFLQYLPLEPKEYVAEVAFGRSTATYDAEGETLDEGPVPDDLDARIAAALPAFLGLIQQVPPMYSAVKIGGQPLYKAARRGEEVERTARQVHLATFETLAAQGTERTMRIVCSGGTYVRTLAHDLGAAIGVPAHLSGLRRIAVGRFREAETVPLEGVSPMDLRPLGESLDPMPRLSLDPGEVRSVREGRALRREDAPASLFAALCDDRGRVVSVRARRRVGAPPRVRDSRGDDPR